MLLVIDYSHWLDGNDLSQQLIRWCQTKTDRSRRACQTKTDRSQKTGF